MRIIFLTLKIDLAHGGGANRGLDIKLRCLKERGHDIRLLTIFPELNRLPPEGAPYPIEAVPCADHGHRAIQAHALSLMRRYESQADIYHIDGVSCLWAGGMYRQGGGKVPTVAYLATYTEALNLLTYETPELSKGFLPWLKLNTDVRMVWLKHWLWSQAVGMRYAPYLDRVFVPSPIAGDHYAHFGFPKDRIDTMAEFIDAQHFLASGVRGGEFPKAFSAERPFRLLHAGRLMRMKGVDLLIRAVAGLRHSGRHVTATIIGDGPQREYLERLTRELGVADSVTFVPWKEEGSLAPAYAACDTFVHPCRFPEPLGRTVVEAMFFGRPIVTTKGSGSAWAAGDAGAICAMDSANDLEFVLTRLYDEPRRLGHLASVAPSRVAFFDVNRWADMLEETLTHLHTTQSR